MSFNSKTLSRRMKKVESATVKHARRFVFRRLGNAREVRRHITIWVLTIGLLIGASGLQVFWYQQSYRVMANAENGTYAEGVLGPIETLNPLFASSSAEEAASSLLFSRLLTYDTSGKLNYDLAESMKIGDDQKSYTITIRPDAQWQDGMYIQAKDVVFTVNLLKNPQTRSTITGWEDIDVKAIDGRTVTFQLPAVYAPFPHALNFLPILPEHILRDVAPNALRENDFSTAPIGSGPFTVRFIQDLDETTGRKIIHMARNNNYFRGATKLERFQLHVYDSSEAIVRGLNTSEINAATDIPLTSATDINKERYGIKRTPVNGGVYALFNTTGGILSDVKVRRALQFGTDTETLRAALGEKVPALDLPFLPSQVAGELPSPPKYDLKQAARLLDESGWKLKDNSRQKDGQPLKLVLVTTKNSDFEKVLEELNRQWQQLGITVTTSIADPTDPAQNFVQNILQPRNYDVLLYRLTIGGDPDGYAYWHSSQASGAGRNLSNYSNSIADEALVTARGVTQKNLRDAKYVTFAKQWLSDAPAIGIYQSTSQYVYGDQTHAALDENKYVNPTDRYADVLYWSVGKRIVHRTP